MTSYTGMLDVLSLGIGVCVCLTVGHISLDIGVLYLMVGHISLVISVLYLTVGPFSLDISALCLTDGGVWLGR